MFLIYISSGGLFHNLRGLTSAIKVSKIYNKKLILNFKNHSPFKYNFSKFFTLSDEKIEWYEDIEIIKKFLPDIDTSSLLNFKIGKDKHFYLIDGKNKSLLKKLNLENDIEFYMGSGNILNNIHPAIKVKPEIIKLIEKSEKINNKYISVHFRNTDISNNKVYFILEIKKLIKKFPKINTVYLATDDSTAYEIFSRKLDVNVIRRTIPEQVKLNLHYGCKDKFKELLNCLTDCYFILKSDIFVPSINSGFSLALIRMIKDKYSFFGPLEKVPIIS